MDLRQIPQRRDRIEADTIPIAGPDRTMIPYQFIVIPICTILSLSIIIQA